MATDANGNLTTGASGTVTITLNIDPRQRLPHGTLTQPFVRWRRDIQ